MTRKSVKMQDIADKFNVSAVTVSNALSDKQGVSEDLRAKIKSFANEIGYKFNSKNSDFDSTTVFNIGIIVSERFFNSTQSFYLEMYKNIVHELAEINYYSMIEIVKRSSEKANEIPALIQNNKINGLIVLGQVKEAYLNTLIETHLPLVCLDFYVKNSKVPTVLSDNFYGSYSITNYLFEMGHTQIGFVGSINSTSSIQDRYLGYYKCMLQHNIEINPDWIIDDRSEEGEWINFTLPEKMPTALVCNCDETAYYLISYLNTQGYSVPEDISIVGFDDYIYSKLSKPQLTTVQVDMQQLAKSSINLLVEKIENTNSKNVRINISGDLIVRDSVKKLI